MYAVFNLIGLAPLRRLPIVKTRHTLKRFGRGGEILAGLEKRGERELTTEARLKQFQISDFKSEISNL
jgi:hypothetical protein